MTRNDKLTRRAFLTGAAVLTGSLLVACGPKAEPTTAPQQETSGEQPKEVSEAKPAPKETVTIKFHDRAGSHADWHLKRVPLFEEQNPGIKLEIDAIPDDHIGKQYALAASGTIGDVVWCYNNGTTEMVRRGVAREINDIVEAEQFDLSVFWPAIIQAFTIEDKLYGIPNHGHYGTNVYYYNEDMFEAAGVPLPNPDWTVLDLVEAAKKMTKEPDVWGLRTVGTGAEHVPSYLRMFGGELMNPEGTKCLLDSDASREALKWLYDLRYTYKVDPCICGDQTRDNFVAGKVGCYNWTPGYAAEFNNIKDWTFKWNAMIGPVGPNGHRGTQVSGAAFCVTKASKHPYEAFRVLDFFSTFEDGVEHVWGGAGSPGPRNDCWESQRLNDYHPIYRIILEKHPEGPAPYYYPANGRTSEFTDTMNNTLQAIWTGAVGLDEGIAEAQRACQEILDRDPA